MSNNITSNNITTRIETVELGDTNYGRTLNERLGTINDNFDAIVNSNLLKGEPGTSIITKKISFDSSGNSGIYDEKIHRWIAEIICGAQSVDPDGNSYYNPDNYDTTDPSDEVAAVMNNIKNKFIILQYEKDGEDKKIVSCIPFVYIDPRTIEAPGEGNTYTDLSCTVYYDVAGDSFVKEHNFPTLYYDTNSSLFKWRIHGQNTELVAKGPAGTDGVNGNMMLVKYNSDYEITGIWMNDLDLSQNYTGSWVEGYQSYQQMNPNARNGDVVVGFPDPIPAADSTGASACVVSTLIKGTDSWYIAQPKDGNELASIYRIAVDNWLKDSLDAIGTTGFVDSLYVPMRESDTLTIAPTQRNGKGVHMIKSGEIDNVVAGKTLNIKYDNVNLGGTVNGGANFVSETDWKKLSIPTTRDEFESIVARLVLVKYENYGEEMYRYSGKVEYNNADYYSFTCNSDNNQMFLYSDFHEGWRECNLYRIIQDKIEDDYDENNPIYTPGLVIYEDGIYTGRTEHIKGVRLYNLCAEAIYSNGVDVGLTKIRDKGDWSVAPQEPPLLPGSKKGLDKMVEKMILRKSTHHLDMGYDFYHFSGIDRYEGRNFYKFISDTDPDTSLLFSEYDEKDFTQGKLYKLIKEKTEGRTAGDFSSNIKNADIIIMSEEDKRWDYGEYQIEDIYITDTPSLFTECLRAPLISTSRLIVDGEVITASTANVSYDYLKKMRDGGTLTPGHFYRIIDYMTTTTQENTSAVGHPFDVIVLALSNDKLSEEAWAMHSARDTNGYFADSKLEAWKLWYCLDNDPNRFAWADTTNGTGVIYRMIDEFGNDCPYDFKNILFKGYKTFEYPYGNTYKDSSLNDNNYVVMHNTITPYFINGKQQINNIRLVGSCSYNSLYNCFNCEITAGKYNTIYHRGSESNRLYINKLSNQFIFNGDILANNVYQSNQ